MTNNGDALANLLTETRRLLNILQHEQFKERRRDLIEDFMIGIYKIGLLLHQQPVLRTSAKLKEFVEESQSLLLAVVVSIRTYVRSIENKFYGPWVYDEWTWVAKRRSAIEFLRELFHDTSFEEFFPFFNTEDIDRMFPNQQEIGGYLPVETIPEGIPPSHWWWWYPEVPPSSEASKTGP